MLLSISLLLLLQTESAPASLPEVTVVARRPEPVANLPLSVYAVPPDPVAVHPNQAFDAAPGTWISRGSGQEHLTAIRSPVLTGPGACGAFLILENGVPVRPPGFCNVNNLFETFWEGAASIDVLAGPGSALYGANALHGSINVEMPREGRRFEVRVTLGDDEYRQLAATAAGERWLATAVVTDAGSFREDEGFGQQKIHLRHAGRLGALQVDTWLTATNLNQETAGFIFGKDAYRDRELRRENLNPEAFRDASSLRLASRFSGQAGAWDIAVTPFARSSRMDFLQHFLPGKPLEENGQDSLGVQLLARREGAASWTVGLDLDTFDGFLRQTQDGPVEGGPPFLVETRPPGRHYDFDVDGVTAAAFAEARWAFAEDWTLVAGLRAERTRYRYDNRMLDGNTRDDGTPCGFGGCLYTRPADRSDSFSDFAPRLSLLYDISPDDRLYARLARGFRPPQATELYRLQSGQTVADLESEELDAAELGYRFARRTLTGSASAFYQSKDNFIFRDAEGFNVADGRTRHRGVELGLTWRLGQAWSVDGAASLADHVYASGRTPDFGESFATGNEVDTAPSTLGRLAVSREALFGGTARAEWVHQGAYYLDAANAHRYPGHDLLHLQWTRSWGPWALLLRLENVTDEAYAERADFAFGEYRYFPGQDRTGFVSLSYRG